MKVIERRVHSYTLGVDAPLGPANSTEQLRAMRDRVDALAAQFRQAVADRCGVQLRAVGAAVTVTHDVHSGRVSYNVQANTSAVGEEEWPELVLPKAP